MCYNTYLFPRFCLIFFCLFRGCDHSRMRIKRPAFDSFTSGCFSFPVLTIAAFAALGLFRYGMVTQVILLLECCPAASITSVFAVQFHHDEQFAAGSVVLTTLLSILFLPLCALIITMF